MPNKKQPARPSLQMILDEVRSNGVELRSHGEQLRSHGEELRAQRDEIHSHGEELRAQRDEIRSHSVILEDMRSQNRITIEAVEAFRQALEERIDRMDQESRSRDAILELAIRDLKITVQQNTLDIRDLAGKVDALVRLEDRVAALERRAGA